MKVAILTFHRANNFGAVLQAYALVKACEKLGASAEVLDWRSPCIERLYYKLWKPVRNPICSVRNFIWRLAIERKARLEFERFRSLIPCSSPVEENICETEAKYDVFIVGSDQVWNPCCTGSRPAYEDFDRSYLLGFVDNKRKCAYAASMGIAEIEQQLKPLFVEAWKKFDIITMRETVGGEYVRRMTGRDVDVVLDPVFLHDVSFWRGMQKNIATKGGFVLLYNLWRTRNLSVKAQEVACREGLETIDLLIPAQPSELFAPKKIAGPQEFLFCIDQAEFVFTNSFHAAAFSIIYGKKLYLEFPKSGESLNSRLTTLLNLCEMKGSIVFEDEISSIVFYDCHDSNTRNIQAAIDNSYKHLSQMVSD